MGNITSNTKHNDSNKKRTISRRDTLKGAGSLGLLGLVLSRRAHSQLVPDACPSAETQPVPAALHDDPVFSTDLRKQIFRRVWQTPFIDTHEHLIEEKDRLDAKNLPCDDWSLLLWQYIRNDMLSAGMPAEIQKQFFSPQTDPLEKWRLLEPYWPTIKNTGFAQAVCITIKELYNIEDFSPSIIGSLQAAYLKTRRPGFYKHILRDCANIESCQVNGPSSSPFTPSAMPDLLMKDLSIRYMIECKKMDYLSEPTGITVNNLSDWHRVIDWWFDRYGDQAVAVKTQHAYSRDIDHPWTPADTVEKTFKAMLDKIPITDQQEKSIQDHLFWYAVNKATEHNLPVKIHIGYIGGNRMPLARLAKNPHSAADLCFCALKDDHVPKARFVFMHICYPYYEEMIPIAKNFVNAYIDMCWSWIINPVAAQDFLKKFLVTAPINKILTFGGDYDTVETVLGHAMMARRGIALALAELVEVGWLSLPAALDLIPPIMHANARKIFRLDQQPLEHSS
jgi:uncharacterized protein